MTRPSESEIYKRHLDFYMETLSLPSKIMVETSEQWRLESILKSRECDEEVIDDVLRDNQNFKIDYFAASSKFVINGKQHWRLNKETDDGNLISAIRLKNVSVKEIEFYPLDDVAGFVKIDGITINGDIIELSDNQKEFRYMKKVGGHYDIPIDNSNNLDINIVWHYKKVFEYLNSL